MFDSLRGRFLIAAKRLSDPNFYRSVVLIVEHNTEGAMGLVVNRPSSVTVAHALADHFDISRTDEFVYIGGPVQPSELFVMHNRCELDPDEPPVVPGLFVGSNSEVFENVVSSIADESPETQFRVFCGCAGWAPGQLEGEIDRGDWFQVPATAEMLFEEDPYTVWDLIRRQVHRSPMLLPDLPGRPEWN